MRDDDILVSAILEDAYLTLEQVAGACAVSHEWVVRRVQEGVLTVTENATAQWRFSSRDLARARRIGWLERDFDAAPELAALVADLIEEIETLRTRLRRAGLE